MLVGVFLSKARRQFLPQTSLGLLAAATPYRALAQQPSDLPPGAPPAFGTGPAVGPEVSASTFAEAEKLMQIEMTATERAMAAGSWRKTMAALYGRPTWPRTRDLESTCAPPTPSKPL